MPNVILHYPDGMVMECGPFATYEEAHRFARYMTRTFDSYDNRPDVTDLVIRVNGLPVDKVVRNNG
jgi:hypothetical protein